MMTITGATQVSVVEDLQGFTDLEPEWNALLSQSAADCPFLTWDWLQSWWTYLRGSSRLRVLTVRTGNELTAIAPLRLSRGLSVFPQLEFLGTGHAGSDYLDVIARRGTEPESLAAVAQFLDSQPLSLHQTHLGADSLASQLPGHLGTAR